MLTVTEQCGKAAILRTHLGLESHERIVPGRWPLGEGVDEDTLQYWLSLSRSTSRHETLEEVHTMTQQGAEARQSER